MEEYTSFVERVIQAPPVVLGLQLRPFCLGHLMLLKGIDSAFLSGTFRSDKLISLSENKDKTEYKQYLAEIVTPVFICSMSYDDALESIYNNTFKDKIEEYLQELTKQLRKTKYYNMLVDIAAFENYLRNSTRLPALMSKAKQSDIDNNSLEGELNIISVLMSECGYTRQECLNLPFTETISAFLLFAHKNDAVKLVSKDLADKMKELDKATYGES